MSTKPADLLIVEDNPGDVELIKEGLKHSNVSCLTHVVEDGEEALCFLRQKRQYATATRPDLVLLDVNLPKKNGLEVLAEIRADKNYLVYL